MRRLAALLIAGVGISFLISCGHRPTEPNSSGLNDEALHPKAILVTPGFWFLPPTVPPPPPSWDGAFDSGLEPEVGIYPLDGGDPQTPGECGTGPIATLPGDQPPEQLRTDIKKGNYSVNWLGTDGLVPGGQYRAFVSVGARVLGYVDLFAVEGRATDVPADFSEVRIGASFLFKFRVSPGVVGSLALDPESAELTDAGSTDLGVDFTALLTDLHGDPLDGSTVQWSSEDPSLFLMDPQTTTTDAAGSTTSRARLIGPVTTPGEVTIRAESGGLTATAIITVLPGAGPFAVPDWYVIYEGTLLDVEGPGLLANDFDYEGEALTLQSATGPAHGDLTALVTNGRFGYQPDPGFVGTDSFTYVMRDASGHLSAPGLVTIEVLPDPNHPPIAVGDGYSTLEGTLLEVEGPGLLANDFDYEGEALTLQSATGPAHGDLTALVTNGRFGYQPDPGFVGTDSFTYVMRDASGHSSAPGTVTILVLPATGPVPIAVPDWYVIYEGTLLEVEGPGLLANDFDYEGEALTLQSATSPAHGDLTALVTNGRFGYQPDPGFVGTDSFTYVMRDASGNPSAPGLVTIEVLPDPNHPPIAVGDGYSTLEGTLLEVEGPGLLANDFDYEGEALTLQSATGPAHGDLTALVTNGRFGYQPDPGFVGTDSFTYVMHDASGHSSAPGTVTILVLPAAPLGPGLALASYAPPPQPRRSTPRVYTATRAGL